MELLTKLGIDFKLLLAQVVNFLILLFVLWRFLYRPILSLLDKRKKQIEEGLNLHQKAKEELENIQKDRKEILKQAQIEYEEMMRRAKEEAESRKNEIIMETEKRAKDLLKESQTKIMAHKEQMLKDLKQEVAEVVILTAQKVLQEKIDEKKDKELIEKAINHITQN